MNPNELAFFTGLFGSIHCIGMCGPLAFAVPSFHPNRWLVVLDKLVYNLGRTVSYILLGVLIGFAGRELWLSGMQQTISVLTGLLIILAAFSRLLKISIGRGKLAGKIMQPFNQLLAYALQNRAGHLIVGLLNGFLPCGFVYLALAGALNTGNVLASAQYMFWFGMGTLPLMLAAMISTGLAGPIFRRRINAAMPYLMICLGLWFVLRGLNLDIPYLSPTPGKEGVAVCE
ncbi:MAG TPA: sulfite exporter TauE/SafE family protein [Daejeonella sp.]|nr:sulfite exporter TauE/SafE family protein [Daejeonella sp.]